MKSAFKTGLLLAFWLALTGFSHSEDLQVRVRVSEFGLLTQADLDSDVVRIALEGEVFDVLDALSRILSC